MSATGRNALSKIFGSPEYLAWASRASNFIDARKLASEFAGVPKNRCGSRYAQGLQTLCRENPPAPPPNSPTIADIWKQDAAFTEGGLSNFAGAARARAHELGWTAVYVQLMHIAPERIAANEAEMARAEWRNWLKVGWGTYGQGSDPYLDGVNAAAICKRLSLKGWKANGESWAEGTEGYWKTKAFLNGWRDGGAPAPLGWSVNSSDTANFARNYDYGSALSSPGADIDPQVYEADHPGLTVGACLGMLAKVPVPVDRTTMTFSITGTGTGPFTDYRTWPGPRRLWRPDRATPATFEALVR